MTTLKTQNSIDEILKKAVAVFETAKDIPGLLEPSAQYTPFFEKMPEYIHSDKLKIAVVGVIKSGKSTFVNSTLGKELVKRGAGVVTSITTRIQKGKKNKAHIYLRSWDEINARLRKMILPGSAHAFGKGLSEDFDIRRKNDREILHKAYQEMIKALPTEKEAILSEIHSIRHALQGFDAVKDLVKTDETVICLESQGFEKHKEYTGDPDKAFYIRDVCLFVPAKNLSPYIEIADCQGADSTDPSQLSRILAYLEFSNFMIYCISSRMGLRESDIVFLKRIKNLGLSDNIVFINNCDLTEHETLEDLLKVEAGIREDLSMLEINPELYSFSLLYNHFSKIPSKISKKDLSRYESWQKEEEMIQYCDLRTKEFTTCLKQKIEKDRHQLLISNYVKRLQILLKDLNFRIQIFLDLLSSDKEKEKTAKEAVSDFYRNASRIEAIIIDSLEKAVHGIKKEIDSHIRDMFFQDKSSVLSDIFEYVQVLSIDIESHPFQERPTGFNEALFFIFKEFQRRVDLYVLEAVTPLLKKFAQLQEEKIKSFFQSLFEAYQINFFPSDHYSDLKDLILKESQRKVMLDVADMDEIKKILGLQLPAKVFEAQYTSQIRTRAMTDFGLKTLSQFLSAIFDKRSGFSFNPALKKAAWKIKIANQKIFRKQFEQYGADLKIYYFLPLIDAMTRDFREKANQRFKLYHILNTKIDQLFTLQQSEKNNQKAVVLSLKQRTDGLISIIESLMVF